MSASIHFLNVDSGYATARHVLSRGGFDPDAQAAAIEVLMNSADAKDRALVKLHVERIARADLLRRMTADAQAKDALRKLRFILLAAAVVGGIFGGSAMEYAMTARAAVAVEAAGL